MEKVPFIIGQALIEDSLPIFSRKVMVNNFSQMVINMSVHTSKGSLMVKVNINGPMGVIMRVIL